jgi:hypothetical protein
MKHQALFQVSFVFFIRVLAVPDQNAGNVRWPIRKSRFVSADATLGRKVRVDDTRKTTAVNTLGHLEVNTVPSDLIKLTSA